MDQAVDDPTKTAERPAVRVPLPPADPTPEATTDTGPQVAPARDDSDGGSRRWKLPDWWHRDHPVFLALAGFFTGMAYILVVPGLYAAVLKSLVGYERAEDLFPFVLLTLAVPIALLVPHRTRRFGRYMLFGVVATALVVIGVAALVLYILLQRDG